MTIDLALIAAAPLLLAACEAVEWVEPGGICPCCCGLHLHDGHAPNCQLAAAIKAAKGEG